jgi:hypothetical protein
MKLLIFLMSLMIVCGGCISSRSSEKVNWEEPPPACPFCGTTLHAGHSFPDAPVYIGAWQFISANGDITSGEWWHKKICNYHYDIAPFEFVISQKLSGVLLMWWDKDHKRPYLISEYLNGREHGYTAQWNPRKELQYIGILRNGSVQTLTRFDSSGRVSEALVRENKADAGIRVITLDRSAPEHKIHNE